MFDKYLETVDKIEPIKFAGKITSVQGIVIESLGPHAVVGELCKIEVTRTNKEILAEVVALKGDTVELMAYDDMHGIEVGCTVRATGDMLQVKVGPELLGRVIDAQGKPIDGKGPIQSRVSYPVFQQAPSPMDRDPISEQVYTGVRAIDGLTAIGKGQRMGIFAGSGVGKSTLLGMISRNTSADVNVIALIGERGREVREFIENDLGPEGLERSVVIVSTSDTSAVARIRGAFAATAIAEYFRDQGNNVMFLFDSVTRFAMAQREIGLAVGEPPSTRSYTPSVFKMLPLLLERAGVSPSGTITAIYTILVEGDDMDEPIADAVRGILDGHMVLSRDLAHKYHYPAIDILQSISRLATKVTNDSVKRAVGIIRRMLAVYHENESLISIGAYVEGSNPELDEAIKRIDMINRFLRQEVEEKVDHVTVLKAMEIITGEPIDIEVKDDNEVEEQNGEAVSVLA